MISNEKRRKLRRKIRKRENNYAIHIYTHVAGAQRLTRAAQRDATLINCIITGSYANMTNISSGRIWLKLTTQQHLFHLFFLFLWFSSDKCTQWLRCTFCLKLVCFISFLLSLVAVVESTARNGCGIKQTQLPMSCVAFRRLQVGLKVASWQKLMSFRGWCCWFMSSVMERRSLDVVAP